MAFCKCTLFLTQSIIKATITIPDLKGRYQIVSSEWADINHFFSQLSNMLAPRTSSDMVSITSYLNTNQLSILIKWLTAVPAAMVINWKKLQFVPE